LNKTPKIIPATAPNEISNETPFATLLVVAPITVPIEDPK